MRILLATLYKDRVTREYADSKAFMIAENPEHKFIFSTNESSLITEGRNSQFFLAKKEQCDYILFIDSDQVFPADALGKLISLDKPVATGIYFQRQYPFRPVIYKITETDQVSNLPEWPNTPFKTEACGAGFLLIRKDVFDQFEEYNDEPFTMIKNKVNEWAGEDISFCLRCREKGIEIWADPTIRIGHVRSDVVFEGHWDLAKQMLKSNQAADLNTNGLPGWMDDNELKWLNTRAGKMESIVEVGSWKGRSTVALLEGCFGGLVYSVDHFRGSDKEVHSILVGEDKSVFPEFAKNVTGYDNLVILKMDSRKAVSLFADKSIDMIFIDAVHEYEDVKRDIELWMPKAKKIICGHDYCNSWPGVTKAVDELINEPIIYRTIWHKEL